MQFSIIIPAKNEIKNLQATLPQHEKLRGDFDFEVIVADGASTDGTIEFAQGAGARVEAKTKKERETIGEGRNRGAAVAKGEVLVFIDAGVRIKNPKEFFETIVQLFKDNPSLVAAVPRVGIHPSEATTADTLVHGAVNAIIHFFNAVGLGAGKGETQIIRREAFKKVGGYNERLVAAEDNDLMRRLARMGTTRFVSSLQVYDNPSRYRKLGYPHVIGLWILNQLSVLFTGRSYSKEWKRAS